MWPRMKIVRLPNHLGGVDGIWGGWKSAKPQPRWMMSPFWGDRTKPSLLMNFEPNLAPKQNHTLRPWKRARSKKRLLLFLNRCVLLKRCRRHTHRFVHPERSSVAMVCCRKNKCVWSTCVLNLVLVPLLELSGTGSIAEPRRWKWILRSAGGLTKTTRRRRAIRRRKRRQRRRRRRVGVAWGANIVKHSTNRTILVLQ